MDQNEKKLQELMSSLNAYSRQQMTPTMRWKITDLYEECGGQKRLADERAKYVLPLLQQQYRNRVAMRGKEYTETPQGLFDKVVWFLTNPKAKPSILFNGIPGTGKTTIANAIMDVLAVLYKDEAMKEQITLKRCKASELGEMVKKEQDKFKRFQSATVLFIDDVAFSGESEVVNDYGTKRRPFDDLLEYRYDRQLMTICTSNLTEMQFKEKYGERIYSRMCEMFMILQCGKTDYRQQ